MGQYKLPKPVKLVIGMLSESKEHLEKAVPHLIEKYGELSHVLEPFAFEFTNYYEDEIGDAPFRSFVSFKKLIPREDIVDIKRWTNDLELSLFEDGIRHVNLDPGYMTLGQFFLATTKDQRQRVYIRDGIFVEPTLYFQKGDFHHFDWTYYDYRSEKYIEYFKIVRQELAFQTKPKSNKGKIKDLEDLE